MKTNFYLCLCTLLASSSIRADTHYTQEDSGNERTVTDTGATGLLKFYHVKVEKPKQHRVSEPLQNPGSKQTNHLIQPQP
ncbi:MAG: hypothetical protein NTW21_17560 [Verrucomicrobia bacterium]|nr:hypothetical protein [Verrucomicrobiota bacterium]